MYGNKKLFQDGRLRSIKEKYCIEILYRKLFQGGRLRVRAKVPWRGPAYGQGCVQVNMFNKYVGIQLLQLLSVLGMRIQRLKKIFNRVLRIPRLRMRHLGKQQNVKSLSVPVFILTI